MMRQWHGLEGWVWICFLAATVIYVVACTRP